MCVCGGTICPPHFNYLLLLLFYYYFLFFIVLKMRKTLKKIIIVFYCFRVGEQCGCGEILCPPLFDYLFYFIF